MAGFEDAASVETYTAYKVASKEALKKVSGSWVPFYFVVNFDFGGTKKDALLVGVVDKTVVKGLPATKVTGKCKKKGDTFLVAPKVGKLDDARMEKLTRLVTKINPALANVRIAGQEEEEEEEDAEETPPSTPPEAPVKAAKVARAPAAEDEFLARRKAEREAELKGLSTPGAVGALKKASVYKDFPSMMMAMTHATQVLERYDAFAAGPDANPPNVHPPVSEAPSVVKSRAKVEKARTALAEVRVGLNAAKDERNPIQALTFGNALAEAKTQVEAATDAAWDAIAAAVQAATGAPPPPNPNSKEEKERRALEAQQMRERSQAQALAEGKIDWEFRPDKATMSALAQVTLEAPEFSTFTNDFNGFLNKYGLGSGGELPVKLWKTLLKGMKDDGFLAANAPKAADGRSFILAMAGPDGKLIREKMLADAMMGLKPFVDHASKYLDQVVAQTAKGSPWAFWSGAGALDSAKGSGGISLEGTVGSFFGTGLQFPNLTSNSTLPLWGALSEMYAQKAAQYFAKFKFIGFVGPGATREQSVFNMIEQPTFVGTLEGGQVPVAAPQIDWFVVDCEKNDEGRWEWTKKAPEQFSSRADALARVTARYGG